MQKLLSVRFRRLNFFRHLRCHFSHKERFYCGTFVPWSEEHTLSRTTLQPQNMCSVGRLSFSANLSFQIIDCIELGFLVFSRTMRFLRSCGAGRASE